MRSKIRGKGERVAERFQLVYEGPATEAHEMDIRLLAPALFTTAEVFQRMNAMHFPDNPPVTVNIKASREGSLDVELVLVALGGIGKLLTSPEATAAANLATLLGGFGKLIEYFKFLREKDVESVQPTQTPGDVTVRTTDGASMSFPASVRAFAEDATIQHSVAEIVRPLGHEGYEQVLYKRESFSVGITKDEAAVFLTPPKTPPAESEVVNDDTRDMALRIVSPWFKRGNKWKFTDGQSEFWATIEQEQFVGDVLAARVVVTPQDLLHCRVRIVQKIDSAGALHTEYQIVRVTQHVSRPQRGLLKEGPASLPPPDQEE